MNNCTSMGGAIGLRKSGPSKIPKVLIVEDEAIVAADLQYSVNALGYDAYATAASAQDALEKARQITPDVVLMDIHLQGHVTGIESAVQLIEECDAAIVFLTAHADDSTIERARKSRPSGYLLKPVTPPALKAAIGLAMDARNRDHWSRVREMTLKLRDAELSDVLDSITSAVLVETIELKLRHVNQPFCAMFGLGDQRMHTPGTDSEWLMQSIGAQCEEHAAYTTLVTSLRRMKKPASADLVRLLDGRVLERDYVPLFRGSVPRGHLWSFRDVTRRERERLQVVESASRDQQQGAVIDELTGLYNRSGFIDMAQGFLRFLRRNQQKKILFYFDLYNLQSINQQSGNGVGDQAIRDMADILRECFRDSDLVGRVDGDEFAVLACMPPGDTQNVKNRVLTRLEIFNTGGTRIYRLDVSIGMVEHVTGEKPEALLSRAEEAMTVDRRARQLVKDDPRP
jgi:diguanylate cyclase (GGDEF)-like protein